MVEKKDEAKVQAQPAHAKTEDKTEADKPDKPEVIPAAGSDPDSVRRQEKHQEALDANK